MSKTTKKQTYWMYDSVGGDEERVTIFHPNIGKYLVRASVLLYVQERAEYCCHWLNKMLFARQGAQNMFKVINYKQSSKTWVVARKLVANDLVSAMDELIEVKQR